MFFILTMLVGGGMIAKVAADHDQDGILWGIAALVVSGLFYFAAHVLLAHRLAHSSSDISIGYAMLTILAPICACVLVGMIIVRLPPATPHADASSWRMSWLGESGREANTKCRVFVLNDALIVEPVSESVTPAMRMQLSSLIAYGDGQAVCLTWEQSGAKERALFLPRDAPKSREAAVLLAKAIAANISKHTQDARRLAAGGDPIQL